MDWAILGQLFGAANNHRHQQAWQKAIDARVGQMSANGISWRELDVDELNGTNQGVLAHKAPGVSAYGALDLNGQAGQLRIIDVVCDIATTDNFFKNSFHTVATVTPSQRYELPHFYYYPSHPGRQQTMTAYQHVDSDLALTNNYVLESDQPRDSHALFETKFAYETLCPLASKYEWAIEWVDSRLVIYGWNCLIPAADLQAYASVVMQVADLLQPASEAYQAERGLSV